MTQEQIEEIFANIFSDKYTRDEKTKTLGLLEKNTDLMVELFQKYYPEYVINAKQKDIAKFNFLKDTGIL